MTEPIVTAEQVRELLAKRLFEIEGEEENERRIRDGQAPIKFAEWPTDWLKQPYCQREIRRADAILALLAPMIAERERLARLHQLQRIAWKMEHGASCAEEALESEAAELSAAAPVTDLNKPTGH